MTDKQDKIQKRIAQHAQDALREAQERRANNTEKSLPKEINGYRGKEPTRYDDWEKKGLTYDF